MDDKIKVTIKVQDETGQPIPYVTVWQFIKVNHEHTRYPERTLSMDDLWRITSRYNKTSEFALRYGEQPVPNLIIPVMGNQLGIVNNIVDYAMITGEGNRYPRPEPTTFGYTFMKRGYLPEKLEFTIPRNKSRIEATVTLKRDPETEVADAPYVQAYDRIRYDLSDTYKNINMSNEGVRRIERIEKELEQAAQQAVANSDNKTAASIYIRMRYLPEVTFIEGKIAGFEQTNISSERSKRAIKHAYELDPKNLFTLMFSAEGIDYPKDAEIKERISLTLTYNEMLIEKYGEAVWPVIYQSRALGYAELGDYIKAELFYKEAVNLEPKYPTQQIKIKPVHSN